MTKTTIVTLAAARKHLARAYVKAEEPVGIYGVGLVSWASKLECGIRTLKDRAVRHARLLVEAMVARELTRVEKLVIKGSEWNDDPGFSTVYLVGSEVLLVVHSSQDKIGLGRDRQAELDRFLAQRKQS